MSGFQVRIASFILPPWGLFSGPFSWVGGTNACPFYRSLSLANSPRYALCESSPHILYLHSSSIIFITYLNPFRVPCFIHSATLHTTPFPVSPLPKLSHTSSLFFSFQLYAQHEPLTKLSIKGLSSMKVKMMNCIMRGLTRTMGANRNFI